MLMTAMDQFQIAKLEHSENVKAQYTDKTGTDGSKNYFRASELGSGDRKIIYGLFGHIIPKSKKTAKNLRQLENGNFVHDRYQNAWEDMGVLISMEERLSSFNDEYLAQYPWEWAGHYDGLLDINVVRAHALGLAKVESLFNEEQQKFEIQVELDEAYADSVGIFEEDYVPLTMVADIKTMNPWGFKRIKEKADISEIGGYLDQIQFYMYMLNTPYGSIYIESKDNNDVVEVQVVWKDLHEGVEYVFEESVHGEQTADQVRAVLTTGRFFGDETHEGCVPRLNRLWGVRERLQEALATGNSAVIAEVFREVPRCADKADSFPCSWGHATGKVDGCEFRKHCWSPKHQGMALTTVDDCPPESVWEFEEDNGTLIRIDSRKVPEGVQQEGFLALVIAGVLDYTRYVIEEVDAETSEVLADVALDQDTEKVINGTSGLFGPSGVLLIGDPAPPEEALEQVNAEGKRLIYCTSCKMEIIYQKLGPGNTKKCSHCAHVNRVRRA